MVKTTKERITLVCVETREDRLQESAKALASSMSLFPCKEALFISHKKLDTKNVAEFKDLTFVTNIRKLDEKRHDYDYFMLTQLPSFIETTHYLVLGSNGYIVGPSAWDDGWLDFHYIGAPWPYHPKGYYPPHPPCTEKNSVGNGRFSLRSTLMGKYIQEQFYKICKQPSFATPQWSPEDVFISRTMRPLLETKGFRFAPESVANRFSCMGRVYNGEFGFYGQELAENKK